MSRTEGKEDSKEELKKVIISAEEAAQLIAESHKDPDLRHAVLIANFFSSISHAKSILALTESKTDAGISGILRTMVEELINAKFLIDDRSGIMAKAYYLESERRIAGIITSMIKIGIPKYFTKTESEWATKLKDINEIIEDVKASEPSMTLKWPKKKHRAESAGLNDTYLITEWLFSQDVHSTPYALDRFLAEKDGVIQLNPNAINSVNNKPSIKTASGMILTFMKLCSEELGTSTKEDLVEFNL